MTSGALGNPAEDTAKSEWLIARAGEISVYATVILGYFFTLLSARLVVPAAFLGFTLANICYLGVSWATWTVARQVAGPGPRLVAGVTVISLLTVLIGALATTGLEFDWPLYFAAVGLYISVLPPRLALLATALLYGAVLLALGWLSGWTEIGPSARAWPARSMTPWATT